MVLSARSRVDLFKAGPPILPQTASLFFTRLPGEIRSLIYSAYLDDIGGAQHVFKDEADSFAFCGCVIDHEAIDDGRGKGLEGVHSYEDTGEADSTVILRIPDPVPEGWYERLASTWGNHWPCREAMLEGSLPLSPTLGPLLTCKQMHDEFSHVLLHNLSYVFTDYTIVTDTFLGHPPRMLQHVRDLKVSFSEPHDWEQTIGDIDTFDPWVAACDKISRLEQLRSLSIWFVNPVPAPRGNQWWTKREWYDWTTRLFRIGEKVTISLPSRDDDLVVVYGRRRCAKSTFIPRGRFNYQLYSTAKALIYYCRGGFIGSFGDDLD